MTYCRLTVLIVACAALFAVAAPAGAEDENKLAFASIDVSDLLDEPRPSRGLRLGITPSNFTWPERKESTRGRRFAYLSKGDLSRLVYGVRANTWDEIPGAQLEVENGRLIVQNKADVIAAIRELVRELRAHAARRALVAIDVWRGPKGSVPRDGASPLHAISLTARQGLSTTASATTRSSYVGDYEVEIAQGSNISNPINHEAVGGLAAELRATPTADNKRVLISGVLQYGKLEGMRKVALGVDEEYIARPYRSDRKWGTGIVELPRFQHSMTTFNAIMANGAELAIPVMHRDEQHTFRLRTQLSGSAAPASIIEFGELTHWPIDASLGMQPETGTGVWWGEDMPFPVLRQDDPDTRGRIAEPDSLSQLIRRAVHAYDDQVDETRVLGHHRLQFAGPERMRRAAREFLDRHAAVLLRPLRVEVRVMSTPARTIDAGPGKELTGEKNWVVTGGDIHTLSGRVGSLLAGTKIAYLADYDVEVAQEARIADPIVGMTFDGLAVNVTPHAPSGSQRVSMDVTLRLATATIGQTPYDPQIQYLGSIDRLKQERTAVDTNVEMGLGESYVIDAGIDPQHKERRLAIVLRVTAR